MRPAVAATSARSGVSSGDGTRPADPGPAPALLGSAHDTAPGVDTAQAPRLERLPADARHAEAVPGSRARVCGQDRLRAGGVHARRLPGRSGANRDHAVRPRAGGMAREGQARRRQRDPLARADRRPAAGRHRRRSRPRGASPRRATRRTRGREQAVCRRARHDGVGRRRADPPVHDARRPHEGRAVACGPRPRRHARAHVRRLVLSAAAARIHRGRESSTPDSLPSVSPRNAARRQEPTEHGGGARGPRLRQVCVRHLATQVAARGSLHGHALPTSGEVPEHGIGRAHV